MNYRVVKGSFNLDAARQYIGLYIDVYLIVNITFIYNTVSLGGVDVHALWLCIQITGFMSLPGVLSIKRVLAGILTIFFLCSL